MKISKAFTFFAAALFAVGAFADAANVLISFSTTADYYADGTPVLDGEWYALCWASDGVFDGINLDCEPVDENDRIFKLAPLARNGHCPYVLFQVDSREAPTNGVFAVYLLDTRDVTQSVVSPAVEKDGRRVPANVVNGSSSSMSYSTSTSLGNKIASSGISSSGSAADWKAVQPKITAFEVFDSEVKITVAGMMSGLTYKVRMGETIDNMSSYSVTPETEGGEAFFCIDPKEARFFKVIAE